MVVVISVSLIATVNRHLFFSCELPVCFYQFCYKVHLFCIDLRKPLC